MLIPLLRQRGTGDGLQRVRRRVGHHRGGIGPRRRGQQRIHRRIERRAKQDPEIRRLVNIEHHQLAAVIRQIAIQGLHHRAGADRGIHHRLKGEDRRQRFQLALPGRADNLLLQRLAQ